MNPVKRSDLFGTCLGFDPNCANTEISNRCVDGSVLPHWFPDQGKGCGVLYGLIEATVCLACTTFELEKRAPNPLQCVCGNLWQRPYTMVYFYELKSIFKHELAFSSGQILHTQIDSLDRRLRFCWLWPRFVRGCARDSRECFDSWRTYKKNKLNTTNRPKHAVEFIVYVGSVIYIYMCFLPVSAIQKCLLKCVMLKAKRQLQCHLQYADDPMCILHDNKM